MATRLESLYMVAPTQHKKMQDFSRSRFNANIAAMKVAPIIIFTPTAIKLMQSVFYRHHPSGQYKMAMDNRNSLSLYQLRYSRREVRFLNTTSRGSKEC